MRSTRDVSRLRAACLLVVLLAGVSLAACDDGGRDASGEPDVSTDSAGGDTRARQGPLGMRCIASSSLVNKKPANALNGFSVST